MSKETKRNVYVGHRYVPKIMGEWDQEETYEGLSIVTYQGTSYTSKKYVPVGIDISNEEFWVVTGNYNAQVETYRRDVNEYKKDVNEYKQETDQKIDKNKQETDQKIDKNKQETDQKIDKNKQETTEQVEGFNESLDSFNDRITKLVSINDYNVDPTGKNDSLQGFEEALNNLKNNETLVLDVNATYRLSDSLNIEKEGMLSIEGNGSTLISEINSGDNSVSRALNFEGVYKTKKRVQGGMKAGDKTVLFNDTGDLDVGDLLFFQSSEQYNSNRSYYKKGGIFTVGYIEDGSTVQMTGSFPYDISSNAITDVSIYKPITVHINNLNVVSKNGPSNAQYGLHVGYSVNTKLENVFSDNFNLCFHISHHYNTEGNHLRSGRSYFLGTSTSYGFASYMGTFLFLKNSSFPSGRHGLELSGFENSFKTTLINVYAGTEVEHVGFNMHESNYDTVAINCIFDRAGLSGHATLIGCTINGNSGGGSELRVSNVYNDTFFVFKECIFDNDHNIRFVNYKKDPSDSNSKYIGHLSIENSTTDRNLILDFTDEVDIRSIVIKNTRNVKIVLSENDNIRIRDVVMEDVVFDVDTSWFSQPEESAARIDFIHLLRCRFVNHYNVIKLSFFERIIIDNCTTININDESPSVYINSTSDNLGLVKIINSEISRITLQSPLGFDKLLTVNSTINVGSNANIKTKQKAVLENF